MDRSGGSQQSGSHHPQPELYPGRAQPLRTIHDTFTPLEACWFSTCARWRTFPVVVPSPRPDLTVAATGPAIDADRTERGIGMAAAQTRLLHACAQASARRGRAWRSDEFGPGGPSLPADQRKRGIMFKDTKAFSGFSVDDTEQAKQFYGGALGPPVAAELQMVARGTSG